MLPNDPGVPTGAQAVDRAVDILEAIAANGPTVGVGEITRLTGLKKPTAIRLLKALKSRGFLGQDPGTQQYRLGANLIRLGAAAAGTSDYPRRAQIYLDGLAERTGETAHYCVMSEGSVLYVTAAEGTKTLHLPSQTGTRGPLHASSAGKVLTCWLTPDALRLLFSELEMTPYTDRTVTNVDRLIIELQQLREQGYGLEDEEVEEGLYSVAVPVRDHTAHIVAALSLSGPVSRLKPRAAEITGWLQESAAALSVDLGYPVTARGVHAGSRDPGAPPEAAAEAG